MERIAMDEQSVEELRAVLSEWFAAYNWRSVRASLNQMFRDISGKCKKDNTGNH
ncbi:hypothetical protein BOX15_Mlig031994g1 [Macrostomum lignano]|uniref:Uncharacterized protein n=1 Tax=Macrostomum lignano TaxID=282301 RepID=A0A267H7N5_9PLAT|nr:hypothetical protein BOX15_Mlig031994g1 [Macrostomum lignano]